MGHHSCCNQQKVKRGLWSPEEDEKLVQYITTHGYGCWSEVPQKAGFSHSSIHVYNYSYLICNLDFFFFCGRASKMWQELSSEMDKLFEAGYSKGKVHTRGGKDDHQSSWGSRKQVINPNIVLVHTKFLFLDKKIK